MVTVVMEEAVDKSEMTARILLKSYYRFLSKFRLDKSIYRVDFYALKDVEKRYYRDVERLNMFHRMNGISSQKVAGYCTYWLCKLRPISVIQNSEYANRPNTSKFVNECFALYVAFGHINSDLDLRGCASGIILDDDTLDSFLYSLRYRVVSGDALAIMFDMARKRTLAK